MTNFVQMQSQRWHYGEVLPYFYIFSIFQGGHIKHVESGLCIDLAGVENGKDVVVKPCDPDSATQKFVWEKYFV